MDFVALKIKLKLLFKFVLLTYLQYLRNDLTVASDNKALEAVAPVGTGVIYNACFIDPDRAVPYLATRFLSFISGLVQHLDCC